MSGELEASVWGALLGAISGGLVSFCGERAHDMRRRRWMLRDQFDDLSIEFGADVNAYWSSDGPDAALQSRILSGIQKIQIKLEQLGIDLAVDVNIRRTIKEIYQFATGGTFATLRHAPDQDRAKQVQKRLISLSAKLPPR